MPRLIRLRKGHVAALCTLSMVLGPLFLPVSSFYCQFVGDHEILNYGLIKRMHTQHRLFSERPLPAAENSMQSTNHSVRRRGGIAGLATVRRIHAADANGDGHGRRNFTQAETTYLQKGCSRRKALLKVFMYDLPAEFHFGMIEPTSVEEGQTWPADLAQVVRYPGGLTQQHSPEYWLTLDLLSSVEVAEEEEGAHADGLRKPLMAQQSMRTAKQEEPKMKACAAIRVADAKDADLFFVPFFSSLSYNRYSSRLKATQRDEALQRRVVDYVMKQEPWKRSKGGDHVLVMHHPNSLHLAKNILGRAIFIVSDFARASSTVSYLGKDIVAPYMHVIPTFYEDQTSFETRPILLFFQGAIHRKEGGIIRQKLYNHLKSEKDVVFKDGRYGSATLHNTIVGMRSSKFCLHLAGDTPSSNRLFDAIVSHCVPVIISEDIELPYEDVLDYSKFCLFVRYEDALKRGFLLKFLRSIGREQWTRMWKGLMEVQIHFEYQFPSQENDATQMLWKSLAHKVPSIKQKLHKQQRYSRSLYYQAQ